MNKPTRNLIDNFIRQNKLHRDGYSLYVSDLPPNYIDDLIVELDKVDKELRETILDYVQTLIDERIDLVFCEDQYDKGLTPYKDNINGETIWR